MKNFKGLKIWQKGMDIVTEIYQLIKKLPRSEVYNLISQIIRSSVSIPSNIAEGGARSGVKYSDEST